MRTDSVNLSDTAMEDIRKQVSDNTASNITRAANFKNKNESAQERTKPSALLIWKPLL